MPRDPGRPLMLTGEASRDRDSSRVRRMRLPLLVPMLLAATLLGLTGCAHHPVTPTLTQVDPSSGYRLGARQRPGSSPDLFVVLSFSGGGTRAAAMDYGVLEALRDTPIRLHGETRRLLDEVDVISGVSGGSLPAAYFGVHGDGIFTDFEARMLKANVQVGLSAPLASPSNWARLASDDFGRTDLAAEYFDAQLFQGATFADIDRRGGPLIIINATDTGLGEQFSFTQDAFDWICADLATYPVARAVAASSALPAVFSPLALESHAGQCGYRLPPWAATALAERRVDSGDYRQAERIASYLDAGRRPIIHLLDGGVTDNLGVRAILDAFRFGSGPEARLRHLEPAKQILFIVVDAQNAPYRDWLNSESAPRFDAVVRSMSAMTTRRYGIETLDRLRAELRAWTERQPRRGDVQSHLVVLNFDNLPDTAERDYFKGMRTSYSLPAADVDKLRVLAGRLLRESREFQDFLQAVNGEMRVVTSP